MWIVDVQLPLDGTEAASTGAKSIPLKTGVTYKLGRSDDCDIPLNLRKVSRLQTEIVVLDERKLRLSNKGHATWVYGPGKELKGGCNDSLTVAKNMVLKLRSSDWKFELFRVEDLKISPVLKAKLQNIDFIEVSAELVHLDSVLINGTVGRIKYPDVWAKQLNSREWEVTGGLAKCLIPEIEREKTVVNFDHEIAEVEGEEEKRGNLMAKTTTTDKKDFGIVDIKPFPLQLASREAKRSRKSQLERMFDEMDDLDDLETYTSQSTQKNKVSRTQSVSTNASITTPPKTSSKTGSNLNTVSASLSKLNLKRSATPEEANVPSKKPKVFSNTSLSPNPTPSNSHLAEVFKRTKKMKMDKIFEDEKLLHSLQRKDNDSSVVKIKKFQVDLQGGSNPRVYSNFRMAYGSDPRWENRLNYSKFVKTTTDSEYNPIMDSTIKTVKFKNSNYKSNELQVNLNQNDDIIPELDSIFGDTSAGAPPPQQFPSRKRIREATLFVDSDDEGSQAIDAHESFREIAASDNSIRGMPPSRTKFDKTKTQTDHTNFSDHYQTNEDDDDTPVFKSRRR
ncbi:hypothetical protein PMKS-003566 [Pichia membranifaciens]|uniref:FHA domain-containing protein n=1 Tax=Pichia membranifaciens TaxID=4926 RepID=A0A1Q2YKJ2_9ASCO|nr:hypothetical protein PMKS-003566 [Pichia membranifaciens]